MNESDFFKWVSALKTYYPQVQGLSNEQGIELWYYHLKDIPYAVAYNALNKWVDTEKWPPTIADIRRLSIDIVDKRITNWEDAWEDALNAVSEYGMYKEKKALDSLKGITRKTVEIIGYQTLCLSEKLSIERAAFREIYNSMADRAKKEQLVSREVRRAITGIQQQNAEQAALEQKEV